MKVVVIAGSTRGIGFGLASSFLRKGCKVVISGRNQNGVSEAVQKIAGGNKDDILGCVCDICQLDQVENLWMRAKNHFEKIDIWINNAGIGHTQKEIWEIEPEEINGVISTNILGMLYCTRVAMKGMLNQGFGQLYNLEGFGSKGKISNRMVGMSVYGTSKAATSYFSNALAIEAQNTPVKVGTLLPGMVMTDLITERFRDNPEEFERLKPIFNIIGHSVEEIAPQLVKKILENRKNGVRISIDNSFKIVLRFLTAKFSKRNIFADMD